MKKILIVSYFFPPGNFAGSYRIYSWAKYLHMFGYYPIIITRNWEQNISNYKDLAKISPSKVIHEKADGYEVYYMPYYGNFRDKLYTRYKDDSFVLLRKILTFFELILQNFTNRVIPFRNIYAQAKSVIEKEKDIQLIIVSCSPFILFKFGYLLNKKYKIKWLADYRDEWNSSQLKNKLTIPQYLIKKLESYSEKRWISNSECFLSVSDFWKHIISNFVSKQGYVVMNGYDEDDYMSLNPPSYNKDFIIVYNGTLYYTQPIEIFLDGLKKTIDKYANTVNIKIYFPGITIDVKQSDNVKNIMQNYHQHIIITDRIKKEEVIALQSQAHALLMIAHSGIKGTYSSKIFEYLACKKPIILCPSDNDVLENIIIETNAGYICNSSSEVEKLLDRLIYEYINKKTIAINSNIEAINAYTRKRQTAKLAEIMNSLLSNDNGLKEKVFLKTQLRNFIFKSLYAFQIDKLLFAKIKKSQSAIILCFHRVSYESDYSYPPFKPSHFKCLINYLVRHFEIISLADISKPANSLKPRIVLSFDDGYMDFKEYVLPVLKTYKLPSVCSIITDCLNADKPLWTQHLNNILNTIYHNHHHYTFSINNQQFKYDRNKSKPELISNSIFNILLTLNKKEREDFIASLEKQIEHVNIPKVKMMQWADLTECLKNKVEIASHTISHDSLITIQNEHELKHEIIESKKILERKLLTDINYFTFPNGLYNNHICEIAKDAGYKYLLATEEEYSDQNNIHKNYVLSRIAMDKKTWQENIFKLYNFHKIFKR